MHRNEKEWNTSLLMQFNLLKDPRARLELVGYYLEQQKYGAAYRSFYSIPEKARESLDLSGLEKAIAASKPSLRDVLRQPLAMINWASLKLEIVVRQESMSDAPSRHYTPSKRTTVFY